jgi:hypothetical protein
MNKKNKGCWFDLLTPNEKKAYRRIKHENKRLQGNDVLEQYNHYIYDELHKKEGTKPLTKQE